MNNNYFEMVKEDCANYITENFNNIIAGMDEINADSIYEKLYDELFIYDGVTGNGSGSYYFNSWKSKDAVFNDMDAVKEALTEFCTPAETIAEKFLAEDWEYFDVTARCYVLSGALVDAIDETLNVEKYIDDATGERFSLFEIAENFETVRFDPKFENWDYFADYFAAALQDGKIKKIYD
jgi:hypothetical protein